MRELTPTVCRAVAPEYVSLVVIIHCVVPVHLGEAGGHGGAHHPGAEALLAGVGLLTAPAVGHREHAGPAGGGPPQGRGAGEGHVHRSRVGKEVKLLIQAPGILLYGLNELVNVEIFFFWIEYQCFKSIFLAD